MCVRGVLGCVCAVCGCVCVGVGVVAPAGVATAYHYRILTSTTICSCHSAMVLRYMRSICRFYIVEFEVAHNELQYGIESENMKYIPPI